MKDVLISIYPWVSVGIFVSIFLLMCWVVVGVVRASSGRKVLNGKRDVLIVLLTFAVSFIALSVNDYSSYYALNRMMDIVSHESSTIKVNGKLITDKDKFVDDLKSIYQLKKSAGTSPTIPYEISLKYDDEEQTYLFKRDSNNKHMYWVYYPGFKYKGNIGYVNTHALD